MTTLRRQRASRLLEANQQKQDRRVNERRKEPRSYAVGDFVFVGKASQATGKLDSGMRGPYKIVRELPHHRYELELMTGSYGKRTQAAAEYMVHWRGEWTPDVCATFFECADEVENDTSADDGLAGGLGASANPAVEDAADRSGEAVLQITSGKEAEPSMTS